MEHNFIFVIDTDQYSGNFERELCAYCTGMYGECEVGKEIAEKFEEKFPDEYNKLHQIIDCFVPDKHGTGWPAAIWPTPGIWNNGHGKHFSDSKWDGKCDKWPAYQSVAIFFDTKPTHEQINFICQRATDYCAKENIKILKFRLIQEIKTEKEIWSSGE